jgi:hypothetical protein
LCTTFNPGAFSSGDERKAIANGVNILDRSPTPPYELRQTQRVSADRDTGRRRRGDDDEAPAGDGTRSKKSIEEALGVEVNDPSQAVAKTFVRPEAPTHLLEYPVIFNPRVTMMVSITQPLYIGGGSVDGRLNIHIRGTRLDDIRLGRVSIDIAGIEG